MENVQASVQVILPGAPLPGDDTSAGTITDENITRAALKGHPDDINAIVKQLIPTVTHSRRLPILLTSEERHYINSVLIMAAERTRKEPWFVTSASPVLERIAPLVELDQFIRMMWIYRRGPKYDEELLSQELKDTVTAERYDPLAGACIQGLHPQQFGWLLAYIALHPAQYNRAYNYDILIGILHYKWVDIDMMLTLMAMALRPSMAEQVRKAWHYIPPPATD